MDSSTPGMNGSLGIDTVQAFLHQIISCSCIHHFLYDSIHTWWNIVDPSPKGGIILTGTVE